MEPVDDDVYNALQLEASSIGDKVIKSVSRDVYRNAVAKFLLWLAQHQEQHPGVLTLGLLNIIGKVPDVNDKEGGSAARRRIKEFYKDANPLLSFRSLMRTLLSFGSRHWKRGTERSQARLCTTPLGLLFLICIAVITK